MRIGVDEDQQVARRARARPALRAARDLPHVHRDDARAVLARDLRRPIRRPVVDDDDLVGLAGGVRRGRAARRSVAASSASSL